MAKENIIVGLDVGTCFIRLVVAKAVFDSKKPQIIGVGQAPSFGLRRGVVVDIDETVNNISQAVQEAERNSGISIEKVVVGISGNHIGTKPSKGVVAVSRADNEVSKEDVERVITAAATISLPQNREIFHVLPRTFSIDDNNSIENPVGMSGSRLEVDALIIEGAAPYIRNLMKCVSEVGLEAEELVLAPLASGRAALNKRQKELGVLCLDLGGGTVGMTVYEESKVIHSCILPVGSLHITNDLAIGLRSSIDLAEKVKLEYGSALISDVGKKDIIDLSKLGFEEKGIIPRIEVSKIIYARLSEIFEMVGKELKKIDRHGLLPAGVVMVGGGAKMPSLVDLAKEELGLPAQIGFPLELDGITEEIDDPSFATAIGLVLWGLDNRNKKQDNSGESTVGKIKIWLKRFLP